MDIKCHSQKVLNTASGLVVATIVLWTSMAFGVEQPASSSSSSEDPQSERAQPVPEPKSALLPNDDQLVVQLAGKITDKGVCHFQKSASKVLTITNAVSRKRGASGQSVFTLKPGDEVIGFTPIVDMAAYWEGN